MEKTEISILIVFILGILILGFYGKFTGNVINESIEGAENMRGFVECNIADFNEDGIVNYIDKEDFGEAFSLSSINKEDCSVLDFNSDGEVSILDANVYNKLYDKNYEAKTGKCVRRKLDCEEIKPKPRLELEPNSNLIVEEQFTLAEEKPSFLKLIKDFFKNLF